MRIEDDLDALRDALPAPDAAFLSELRLRVLVDARSLDVGRPRGRRARRGLLLLVAVPCLLVAAAAFAADRLGSPFFASQTPRAIVSNSFRVSPGSRATLGPVAPSLACTPAAGGALVCAPGPASAPHTYRLVARAGARTLTAGRATPVTTGWGGPGALFLFATGASRVVLDARYAPLIACRHPSAAVSQRCVPLLVGQTLPAGTPVYQDVVR